MLGIRFKNGKPEKIVFIEVKSTESAVKDSKSGLKKHLEGMEKYIKEELKIRRLDKVKYFTGYKIYPGQLNTCPHDDTCKSCQNKK